MGLSIDDSRSKSQHRTHQIFLLANYVLIGGATSCAFLALALRLVPSLCGAFFILLHALTVAGAISGCAAASAGSNRWYGAHMVATVLTAIFQGAVSVLIFTRTSDFLLELKSYVREDDGALILKLAGGLCVMIFCLEWVVLLLAFVLRYHAFVDGNDSGTRNATIRSSAKVQDNEDLKDWPWPFQV
nr:Transmembrane protein [Ipomoea batatas]GME17343.1 Transmembrane protein [Ipomoea batatas]